MDAFLTSWSEEGNDVGALNEARRRVMRTREGAAPRVWAAWSVKKKLPGCDVVVTVE